MKRLLSLLFCFLLVACQPDASLRDNQGNTYRLNDLKGKWLALNVWATWCPPCLVEMPELNTFHSKYRDKAIILGANFDQFKGDKLYKAIKRFQIRFPILQTPYDKAFNLEPPSSLPVTYIYSPDGKLHGILRGAQTAESIAKAMGIA